MNQEIKGSLSIESENGHSKVEIIGDLPTILFNWSLLTESVSARLGLPPTVLMSMTKDCLSIIKSHVAETGSVLVDVNGCTDRHPPKEAAT